MDIKETRLYKDFDSRYCYAADKEKHMSLAFPLIEAHHEEYEKACAEKDAMEKELKAAERKVSSIKAKMKQFDNVGADIFNAHYMEYAKQLLVVPLLSTVARSSASSGVKLPVIWLLPPLILFCTLGYE